DGARGPASRADRLVADVVQRPHHLADRALALRRSALVGALGDRHPHRRRAGDPGDHLGAIRADAAADAASGSDGMIDLRIDDRGAAGRVATVTIDNAAKLNCMSQPVRDGFLAAFAELARDDRLRAVVVTGAGGRAFVGGADVRELAALRDEPEAEAFITEVHRCCDAVRRLPVPVIARVRGYVLGAGLELAACCDMRVASSDSHFGMPEVKIGLPSVIEAALLPQLIGWGRARYLVLTGETVAVADTRDW